MSKGEGKTKKLDKDDLLLEKFIKENEKQKQRKVNQSTDSGNEEESKTKAPSKPQPQPQAVHRVPHSAAAGGGGKKGEWDADYESEGSEAEEMGKRNNKKMKVVAKKKPAVVYTDSDSDGDDGDGAKDDKKKKASGSGDAEDNTTKYKLFWIVFLSGLLFLVIFLKIQSDIADKQEGQVLVDYYSILEIEKTATEADVKRAYKTLVKKLHPDLNPDCKECEEKMRAVSDAYIILSNPETRSYHDTYGVKPPEALIQIAKAKHGGRAQKD